MTVEYRIETESPMIDLRDGNDINERFAKWAEAAQVLVSDAIDLDRQGGSGEEVSLLMTNRQADHLAMGLGMLAAHFKRY